MRIIDCDQGSEEWHSWRLRPTASNFHRIVTPAKGQLSKQSKDYACELVAKMLGVYTEPPPSYWMEWGVENEPYALAAYERLNCVEVQRVGFILPDDTETFGGSPDGLVGDGLLETKCVKPETLIRYHADQELPVQYKPQVQGLLLISGRAWCDFFAWHPELTPFQIRVEADLDYQFAIAEAIIEFCHQLRVIRNAVSRLEIPDQFVRPGELI